MSAYLRDVVSLIAVVSFVATVGVWSEVLRTLV